MSQKHILIVDDDKDILFLLALSVKQLGPEYMVSTALDASSALKQVQQRAFDLVITDYMMPGMSGLELVQEVRRISPGTQVVLMTAYDTPRVRNKIESLAVNGYVGKPFTVPEIMDVVKRVVAKASQTPEVAPESYPVNLDEAIVSQLNTLQSQVGAYYIVLLSSAGYPLHVAGKVEQVRAARLAAFVAANFMAVAELTTLLDDSQSTFHSSYHEGSQYNIYACTVTNQVLLAVVFGAASKPGTVWFYTKQTAAALSELVGPASSPDSLNLPAADDYDTLIGDQQEG